MVVVLRKKLYNTLATFSALILSTPSHGSILHIINAAQLPIEVIIQPEEGNDGPDFPEIHKIIHADRLLSIEIDRNQLGKVESFSVIGKVNFYAISDRCVNLDFNKDYILTLSHKLHGGVSCLAVETPKHNSP